MRKQDRTYSRTPTDLEHKYNLGKQAENVANQSAQIEKIDRALTQFATETNIEIQKLKGQVEKLAPEYDELGVGLKISDRKLCVDSATDFDGDNTRPVEAGFMQTQIGNIEAIFKTI